MSMLTAGAVKSRAEDDDVVVTLMPFLHARQGLAVCIGKGGIGLMAGSVLFFWPHTKKKD